MSNFAHHLNYDAGQEAAVATWVQITYGQDYWSASEPQQASWWIQYLEHLAP